jgi:translation elongation factor EF-Tu-like GTPase
MRLLCKIEDVFEITDRGCVIVPGIPHSPPLNIKVGDYIVVETPSGERFETMIAGIEMINRGRPMEHSPFSVPRAIRKEQLRIGSQVFLKSENV